MPVYYNKERTGNKKGEGMRICPHLNLTETSNEKNRLFNHYFLRCSVSVLDDIDTSLRSVQLNTVDGVDA